MKPNGGTIAVAVRRNGLIHGDVTCGAKGDVGCCVFVLRAREVLRTISSPPPHPLFYQNQSLRSKRMYAWTGSLYGLIPWHSKCNPNPTS